MSILAIAYLLVGFVLVALLVYGMCKAAARADEQSEECYRNLMAQKDCEQLNDEPTAPRAPRRAGLRIVN